MSQILRIPANHFRKEKLCPFNAKASFVIVVGNFLLLELLNSPMATWGASSHTGNVLNARVLWISIARIYKSHTQTHTHSFTHSTVGWRVDSLADQNILYGGGLTFQVKAAQVVKMTNGDNRLWNLSSREKNFS